MSTKTNQELWNEADARIDKAFELLHVAVVYVSSSPVQLKEALDSKITTSLSEARNMVMSGYEYTGFAYIKDLIYLYVKVCEDQCHNEHKHYGERVKFWNDILHMLETMQAVIEDIQFSTT